MPGLLHHRDALFQSSNWKHRHYLYLSLVLNIFEQRYTFMKVFRNSASGEMDRRRQTWKKKQCLGPRRRRISKVISPIWSIFTLSLKKDPTCMNRFSLLLLTSSGKFGLCWRRRSDGRSTGRAGTNPATQCASARWTGSRGNQIRDPSPVGFREIWIKFNVASNLKFNSPLQWVSCCPWAFRPQSRPVRSTGNRPSGREGPWPRSPTYGTEFNNQAQNHY